MRTWLALLFMLVVAVAAMTMGGSDHAPYNFLFDRAKASDEQQRYMHTLVQDSGMTREEMEPLVDDMRRPARDLPIILFLARESGRPAREIFEHRQAGLDWMAIMKKVEVPTKRLFAGVKGTAPEPYKEAWTEWRMKYRPEFTEAQIRELALLQTAARITGRPVEEITRERARGVTAETILARHKPPSPEPAPSADITAMETKAPKGKAAVAVKNGKGAKPVGKPRG